jgi:hypothetical protein
MGSHALQTCDSLASGQCRGYMTLSYSLESELGLVLEECEDTYTCTYIQSHGLRLLIRYMIMFTYYLQLFT